LILTNKVELNFDHNVITRDFVIFEVCRSNGDFKGSKIPDIALQECRAISVVYEWGTSCYVLYHRALAEKHALKQTLERCDKDIRVCEITSVDLEQRGKHRLAQLLLNGIQSLAANHTMYHNVTGALYYSDPKWFYRKREQLIGFWMLQISLTGDYCVKLNVKTFSNINRQRDARQKAQYLIDGASFSLRRALKEEQDPNAERFVITSYQSGKKNTVPFLAFGSYDEFCSCKVGVLYHFLQDVQTYLSPYLKMDFMPLDEANHIGNRKVDTKMIHIRERLKKVPLYLEDTVQNEQSAILKEMLIRELSRYSGISVEEGAPSKGTALIRIIHNREYYEDCPEQDNYADAPKECVVQHVTVEDFHLTGTNIHNTMEKEDCSLRKIIQELAIKLDVFQGKMHCYHWPALGFSSPVAFVRAVKADNETIHYQRLFVEPNGELRFDRWEQSIVFADPEQEKIAEAFENRNGNFDPTVKGVIYESIDQIHIIRDTERYTLPNLEVLEHMLRETRDEEMVPLAPIIEVLENKLVSTNGDERSRCQEIFEELRNRGTQISRKELKRVLNLRTKFGKEISDLIYEETGIIVSGRMKERRNRERIFGGVLDVRHFSSGVSQFYYSGYRGESLKASIPHACRIRKVTSTGDILHFEKYLPLLEVDFVRASAWTVVPFPFKYLREWGTRWQ